MLLGLTGYLLRHGTHSFNKHQMLNAAGDKKQNITNKNKRKQTGKVTFFRAVHRTYHS